MKQSAVEWLQDKLNNVRPTQICSIETILEWCEQAKEMEKKQIIDAWNGGDYAYFYSKKTGRDFADGSEYYNENYGSTETKQ